MLTLAALRVRLLQWHLLSQKVPCSPALRHNFAGRQRFQIFENDVQKTGLEIRRTSPIASLSGQSLFREEAQSLLLSTCYCPVPGALWDKRIVTLARA